MRNDKRGRERKGEDGRRAKVNLDSGVLKIKKTKKARKTHHAPILIASSDRHSVKQRAALILKSQCPSLFTV
jgi:hypothetical protein